MGIVKAAAGPSAAELAFIERGNAAFTELFPGQHFEHSSWDLRHLKGAGLAGDVTLHFTRLKTDGNQPIATRFANIVKAYLATGGKASGTMSLDALGCRWLWEACLERRAHEESAFTWQGFTKDDVERAEELMIASDMNSSSVYRRCKNISLFLRAISNAGIIAPMELVFRTPRTDSLDRLTLAGQEARADMMPSEEAIHGLARLFNDEFDLTPFERLVMCIVAIMFASGLRINETLQLATNALRKEGEKFFLYYFKSKSKLREEKMALSRKQANLVDEAIRRALELTGPARKRAMELVASPHSFPLPNIDDEKLEFQSEEVDTLLGLAPQSSHKLPPEVLRRRASNSNRVLFDRATLQKYLQARREKFALETTRGVTLRADGTWLPIDEALFISFRYENNAPRGTDPLLVKLISQQQIGTFLGGHDDLPSIFERLNLTERNGKPISLNAHQIRHYVTSKAAGAGISDAHIMRWQRREHTGDLDAYIHLTKEERVTRLREHIKSGRVTGEIATMYFQLATDERDVFLENVVQAIHVTHLGFCVHDFNTAPCPKALNCVKRCGSYLHDTTDKQQRNSLLRLKVMNTHALEDAERARKESTQGALVEEWVADLKATNDGIDQILRTVPSGDTSVVAPFKGKPSRFEPLE